MTAGSTVAVVGPTGSGKSTLAGLLVRLVDPADGTVLLDGVDLRSLREGEVSGQAAFVAQGTFLFDDTVRGNVTLGADFADDEVWAALRVAAADDFVAALPQGLDTRVGERGATLSGGQRQRLALARAVVRKPRLLVLDDATSAVDPAVEARILDALRDGERPSTVVVIAYRQATISLADEVVWLENGEVLARGIARRAARRGARLRRPRARVLPGQRGRGVTRAGLRGGSDDDVLLPGDRRDEGAFTTLRRGLRMMPEFRRGLPATFALALIATAGRVVVPIAVQQVIDRGLSGPDGPDMGLVTRLVLLCALVVVLTAVAVYRMNVRLFRTTETALAGLRVRAFRHVHDLSVLHQQGQRRGSLVSRVTSDVDQLSVFMQWGGVLGLVSLGQLVIATVVMAFYSWQLTLLVLACFLPLGFAVRWFAKRLAVAYGVVRERVGDVLGAVSESVVGASTVRAYGVGNRTAARIDAADRPALPGVGRRAEGDRRGLRDRRVRRRPGQRGGRRRRRAARPRRGDLGRHAGRVPVPGHPVRRAGADRERGAQRGAERAGRLPAGARRDRHRAGRAGPGAHRPGAPAARRAARRALRARHLPVLARRPPGAPGRRPDAGTRGAAWRSWGRPARARRRSRSW